MADQPATMASSLDDLWTVIGARARAADPQSSYTARLLAGGVERVAQKVGEEATETVIAGVRRDPNALVNESADLLYHLLVLWQATGVEPEAVAAELAKRAQGSAHGRTGRHGQGDHSTSGGEG
ncbi:MAG: phosphoribosyl-ATP diphosphatase [Rhodospirillales bacterium]|nr:phosphoribosyl-ATP diphosphatase [Rhodospirillales bacterium]MCY4099037.1 phosphoribosyl-ATP diphosphatase [Rhodospirillales bacterium]